MLIQNYYSVSLKICYWSNSIFALNISCYIDVAHEILFHLSLLFQHHRELFSLAASKITNLKKKDMDDKFIICLSKVSKHFPPFMDR